MAGEAFGLDPDNKRYAQKLAGGWPVDFTRIPEADRQVWEQSLVEAAKQGIGPVYYPGSVVRTCPDCGLDIFVGPRTEAAVKADPEIVVKCLGCVAKTMSGAYRDDPEDFGVDWHSLGNDTGIPRTY